MIRMAFSIFQKLNAKRKKEGCVLFILSFIVPVMDLLGYSVILSIINSAAKENGVSPYLVGFTIAMGVLMIFKSFLDLYTCYLQNHFLNYGAMELSLIADELLLKEDLLEHNRKTAVQALTMVKEDTTACMNIVISSISMIVNVATMAGFSLVLCYAIGVMGVAVCMFVLLIMAVVYLRFRKQMQENGKQRRMCQIQSNAQITTAFGAFKEARIDRRSSLLLKRYQKAAGAYADVQCRFAFQMQIIMVLMQNMVITILFFLLAAMMITGMDFSRALASLVMCVTMLLRMLPTGTMIVRNMINTEYARKSYESLMDTLYRFEKIQEKEKEEEGLRERKMCFSHGISIRHLSFAYPDGSVIFDDASADIPAGKSIAIVGASGAGKTTFLNLILGLLKPDDGTILFDDYDIVHKKDTQGKCNGHLGDIVSYIPQTVYLNGETIRNNVAFFEEDDVDEKRVVECLQCAQIYDDVITMKDGLDTIIGENGVALSGGQRQRIALARALYKDFEILVMDEATAALDKETEKAVIDSIREVRKNKTLLLVTHHQALAEECNLVYLVENGKIRMMKSYETVQ